ncbi:MAG TPA: carbamoyltransferase C-terminal domain-containing protein [Chitinophaga sp.]|uniref:carbamoyltransferase family protein n=1 Tax=Chitinophaga sp. TaxID=1869181 RepID=UPI002B5FA094|nr:carbamoyltransferase C-terminal domain-containing protein [Chitinophaga sp.]HVI49000.1 carbamoyltransferase C-terminal domain-containing protein [Chitinophaga sp.]
MKRNYIGLSNTFHDSALAVVNEDGKVVFAEATERYLQNKRAINCIPDFFQRASEIVDQYCDKDAELVLAQTWSDNAEEAMIRGLADITEQESKLSSNGRGVPVFIRSNLAALKFFYVSQLTAIKQTTNTLMYELHQKEDDTAFQRVSSRKYNHHLTHAAAACYTSPFSEGVCAVIDAIGENSSTHCYYFKDGVLSEIEGVDSQSAGSLGAFYMYICNACGFGQLTGEEWKVMGLASYGKLNRRLADTFRDSIKVNGLSIEYAPMPEFMDFFQDLYKVKRKKGEPVINAADIAYTGQLVFTEIYYTFLRNLQQLGLSKNLIIGGGCALNSSANGKVVEETGFEKLHIYSAPADDGNAIGAAFLAYYEDNRDKKYVPEVHSPYLGSQMCDDKLEKLFKYGPVKQERLSYEEIYKRTAEQIARGKIVGWVQGAAEFGPRALGNRSILADPRDPDMKDKINAHVKFREEFRPLAPSILHEYGHEYFENYQEAPYMERTLSFRDGVKHLVPSVVHRDGTGRLQTVKKEWNDKYYELISAFHQLTGVPVLLNTSFNVMGKPIIHTVEDALSVFYTSGLDVLVLNDYYIEK